MGSGGPAGTSENRGAAILRGLTVVLNDGVSLLLLDRKFCASSFVLCRYRSSRFSVTKRRTGGEQRMPSSDGRWGQAAVKIGYASEPKSAQAWHIRNREFPAHLKGIAELEI